MFRVEGHRLHRNILAGRDKQADGIAAIDHVPGGNPLAFPVDREGRPDPVFRGIHLDQDLLIERRGRRQRRAIRFQHGGRRFRGIGMIALRKQDEDDQPERRHIKQPIELTHGPCMLLRSESLQRRIPQSCGKNEGRCEFCGHKNGRRTQFILFNPPRHSAEQKIYQPVDDQLQQQRNHAPDGKIDQGDAGGERRRHWQGQACNRPAQSQARRGVPALDLRKFLPGRQQNINCARNDQHDASAGRPDQKSRKRLDKSTHFSAHDS